MRKVAISLFAAFSLFTPLLVTGCQMGSEEKMEKHDHDDHKDDHKGDHHGHELDSKRICDLKSTLLVRVGCFLAQNYE